MKKNTSLIVTTYNWPEALKLCMESILVQTVLPKEIIIADDGSGKETKELVDNFIKNNPHITIIHSWQEDNGFRLAMSRNKAIAKSTGEYIIVIDGDLILEKHFIDDHIACAEDGCFVQGPRIDTTNEMKDKLLNGEKIRFKIFRKEFHKKKRLIRNQLLSKIYTKKYGELKSIAGCNMSFYRKDFIQINGFEEKFTGWGHEDNEFVIRLFNIGILEKKIKYGAIAYHLFHEEKDRSKLTDNAKFFAAAIENKKVRAEDGVDKYLTQRDNITNTALAAPPQAHKPK